MKWSWRVGRLAGIELRVHATFSLLFVWIVLSGLREDASATTVLSTIVLTLAVFAIVVLHEFGHAVTARHFGIHTRDITLLPIGGIARLERMPREPRQELLIALAGPAVNVALAAVIYATLAAFGRTDAITTIAREGARMAPSMVLGQLFVINVSLAAFNLIPAFPMDGGRALRAVLTWRSRDYAKATLVAARVGRVFALIFGLLATLVIGSPTLVVIAVFVWVAASSEALAVQTSAALENVSVANLMITDVRTLAPRDQLARAARLTIDGFQQDFPVVDDGVLVGMLSRRDLVRALAQQGSTGAVESAMRREYPSATLEDTVDGVLRRLTTLGAGALPVVRGNELLGLLTMENVSEFLMLRTADPASVQSH
jgi:Zn-dependent protease/CBS domain-containing protein